MQGLTIGKEDLLFLDVPHTCGQQWLHLFIQEKDGISLVSTKI